MATPKADPVSKFLSRFTLRDVGHFLVPFVAVLAPVLATVHSLGAAKAALLSAVPGLAAVAFRQIFPHSSVTASEVASAVTYVEKVFNKAPAPAAEPAPAPPAK